MKFLYPEILWALAALAIPIIVHLFNFRRFKRIEFSNVSFLKEVKQETQSKSRIKHLIILASRMLALACLILAFAQPYFHDQNKEVRVGTKYVGIYIDNSFSMDAENSDGRLMDLARNKAHEIVENYSPTDKFLLITNDFEGRHQRLVNQEEIAEWIDEVELSPRVRQLSEVLSRQNDLLSGADDVERVAFIISDLQRSSHDFELCRLDSSISYTLVPNLAQGTANAFIDSLWFDSPARQVNQAEKLNVRIRNSSDQALTNVPIKLHINGSQKAIGSFNVDPGMTSDTALYFTNTETGFLSGKVEIADHPVQFDDVFYFGFEVAEQIQILEIKGRDLRSNHVKSVFDDDEFFTYNGVSEDNVDFGEFASTDLIVLNGIEIISSGLNSEVVKFCENGGSVLMFPATEVDILTYGKMTTDMGMGPMRALKTEDSKVGDINLEHFLYSDVFESVPDNLDLPVVRQYYPLERSSRSSEQSLLALRNGEHFLAVSEVEEGRFYYCASPLTADASNFEQHALFVTSLVRVAEFSQPSGKLYYTIGQDELLNIPQVQIAEDETFHIVGKEARVDFLPQHRHISGKTELNIHGQIQEAGNYDVVLSGEKLAGAAFNYSRYESELTFLNEGEVSEVLEASGLTGMNIVDADLSTLSKSIGELNKGKTLWRLLIMLTLIFLALEVLLIKFWK